MKKQYPPEAIANNLLWIADRDGMSLTPTQLIQLVYVVYGWALALLGRKIFEDPIEAWDDGPTIPRLHYILRPYGKKNVDSFIVWGENNGMRPVVSGDDPDLLSVMDLVWTAYTRRDGLSLTTLTREGCGAWQQARARKDFILDDEDIERRSWEGIQRIFRGDVERQRHRTR
ncbi:MAG TPA: hypothetical protein DDX54_07140 [Rhodospirillaceae bacterium]|nr:hypothetical protein [Rhodospirillaceae bacterium]